MSSRLNRGIGMSTCENSLAIEQTGTGALGVFSPRELRELLIRDSASKDLTELQKIIQMYEENEITLDEVLIRVLAEYCKCD